MKGGFIHTIKHSCRHRKKNRHRHTYAYTRDMSSSSLVFSFIDWSVVQRSNVELSTCPGGSTSINQKKIAITQ